MTVSEHAFDCDRYWLLTWTTYGSWLPGDERGFVSCVREESGRGGRHNVPGTDCDKDIPNLKHYAQSIMKGEPIYLSPEQATVILSQFRETAAYRGWELLAVAIMRNHVHLVVGVPGDPDPSILLRDFKSYASRSLNKEWGAPASNTWWSDSGSKRKLPDGNTTCAAIRYVAFQDYPLVIWVKENASQTVQGEQGA